ncbi:T-lymphocyte activation antigen CD86 isoform X1 [Castor canadensis]|uniref:T-lymphocyte activation antigen CD86 isoform X1 n=2 Tax=Castor canadensis TaxID=51338 RepID=A0AC58MIY7_CASCN
MGTGDSCSTMGLKIVLLLTVFLLCDAASLKSKAYFNETAVLPCQFVNSKNLSLSELVVFWQDQETLVLYELYLGKDKFDNVASKYIGRTSFNQDNWTLQLHNVQIKERGLYQCFIHHKAPNGLIHVHQKSTELSVVANFSEPEIVLISNITGKSAINLTCSSKQGYPRPVKLYFCLSTENSTTKYDGDMNISQHNVTQLYDVSISSSIPFPDGESNVTIFCVLQIESMEAELFSQPLPIVPGNTLPVSNQGSYIAAVVLLAGVCAVAIFVSLCKKKKQQRQRQQQRGVSYNETAEEEESEEIEERVSKRRNEEAQCIDHSSEMLSDDKSTTDFN